MEQQLSYRSPDTRTIAPVVGWMVDNTQVPADLLEIASMAGLQLQPLSAGQAYGCQLVIFDCQHFSSDRIHASLARLREQKAPPTIALYDVPLLSRHEQLVSWPMVKGIFSSGASHDHVTKGMRALLSGENWFPRRILDDWINRQRDSMSPPVLASDLPDLTLRERQILQLVNHASTNAQIAYTLSISEHTVKTHLYNIFRKISVRNRTQASNWVKANLLQVEA